MSDAAPIELAGMFLEWQRIEDAKAELAEQSKDLFKAAKGKGYDTKAMRAVFREKRVELEASPEDVAKAEEAEAMNDLYRSALDRGLTARARPAHDARENIEEFPSENLSYSQSGLSYAVEKGRGDASLIGTVAAGMQTDIGRKALVTALDIMIEREETGEITDNQAVESPTRERHQETDGSKDGGLTAGETAQDDVGATASSTYSITPPTKGESDAKSAHDDSVSEKLLIFGAGQVSGAAFAAAKETGNTTERQPSNDLQNAPAESAADAISATHSNSTADPAGQSNSAGEAPSSPASPATHSDDLEIPAFLRRDEGRGYTKHEASA